MIGQEVFCNSGQFHDKHVKNWNIVTVPWPVMTLHMEKKAHRKLG